MTASSRIPYTQFYSMGFTKGNPINDIINNEYVHFENTVYTGNCKQPPLLGLLLSIIPWIRFRSLQYLWENGLLNYWLKQYSPNVDRCFIDSIKPRGKMTSITLVDLSSAFLLYAIGLGFAVVAFILERLLALVKTAYLRA